MKIFLTTLCAFLLFASCETSDQPKEGPGEVVREFWSQDLQSCTADPTTPWCENACQDTNYSWCR